MGKLYCVRMKNKNYVPSVYALAYRKDGVWKRANDGELISNDLKVVECWPIVKGEGEPEEEQGKRDAESRFTDK